MHSKFHSKGSSVVPNEPEVSPFTEAILDPAPRGSCRYRLIISQFKKNVLMIGSNRIIIKDGCFNYVVRRACKLFRLNEKVQPIHLNDIFFYKLDIRKSSPGIPWQTNFKTRGEVMDDPSARNSIRLFWHKVEDGYSVPAPHCKILYRSYIQHEKSEIRAVVYGYPTTVTLMEACFALPLIDAYKTADTPIAYGCDRATGGAYRLRRRLMKHGEMHYICFNFQRFNKTVSPQLIEIAFNILAQNVDPTKYKDGSIIPNTDKLGRVWNYLVRYFCETPLRFDSGECWQKKAGIPSGSYFTQLIGSIVNWILINYAFMKTYGRFPDYCLVFGDNSVIITKYPFGVNKLAEILHCMGMEPNPSKTIVTTNIDEVKFLGYVIGNGFPTHAYDRRLEDYSEWPAESWDMFTSRSRSCAKSE